MRGNGFRYLLIVWVSRYPFWKRFVYLDVDYAYDGSSEARFDFIVGLNFPQSCYFLSSRFPRYDPLLRHRYYVSKSGCHLAELEQLSLCDLDLLDYSIAKDYRF